MKQKIRTSLCITAAACCLLLSGCKNSAAYDYNLDEYVKLPAYKTIAVDKNATDYRMGLEYTNYSNLSSQEDVITDTELTEGTVQILDTALIDYVGKKDGVAFEGGTASGYELQIGSSSFIDGFESGLIGAKIGETLDLHLTFPENYKSEELAGQPVVFTVTVKGITRPTVPEVTNELAKQLGYDSAAEYHADIEKDYLSSYVWNNFISDVQVLQYPQTEIDDYVNRSLNKLKEQAKSQGTTMESYLSSNGYTVEEYRQTLTEQYAKPRMMQIMTAYSIARKENITVVDDEIDTYISENYSSDSLDKSDRQDIADALLVQKVVEYLAGNAVDAKS